MSGTEQEIVETLSKLFPNRKITVIFTEQPNVDVTVFVRK
jgi:hypothetical protein